MALFASTSVLSSVTTASTNLTASVGVCSLELARLLPFFQGCGLLEASLAAVDSAITDIDVRGGSVDLTIKPRFGTTQLGALGVWESGSVHPRHRFFDCFACLPEKSSFRPQAIEACSAVWLVVERLLEGNGSP